MEGRALRVVLVQPSPKLAVSHVKKSLLRLILLQPM